MNDLWWPWGWPDWLTHSWWYGDFLPWLEPVATTLAFLAAGVAVYLTRRAHRRELDKEKRTQAEQVVVWWRESSSDVARLAHGGDGASGPWPAAVYINKSGLPIYNAVMHLQHMGVTVSPTGYAGGQNYRSIMEPNEVPEEVLFQGPTEAKYRRLNDKSPYPYTPNPRVAIEFTDAGNRRWLRDFDGHLTLLSENHRGDELWINAWPPDLVEAQPGIDAWKQRFPDGSNLDDVDVDDI